MISLTPALSGPLNLGRIKTLFNEAGKTLTKEEKFTASSSLRRVKKEVFDEVKSSYDNFGMSGSGGKRDDSGIDPYDITPSFQKKSSVGIESQLSYSNKLQEEILKKINSPDLIKADLAWKQQVLTRLDKLLASEGYDPTQNIDVKREANEERMFKRNISGLAKALAGLDGKGIAGALASKARDKADPFGIAENIKFGFDMLKDSIMDKTLGDTVRETVKSTLIGLLPKQTADKVNRFKDDPVKLMQDFINSAAYSENATLANFFKGFATKNTPDTQIKKNMKDMNAKAPFDMLFYTSVTDVIPKLLAKAAAKPGEVPVTYDPKTQKWRPISDLVRDKVNNKVDITTSTNNVFKELMESVEEAIRKGIDGGNLSRNVSKTSSGDYKRDRFNRVELGDNEELRNVIRTLLKEGASINSLRGNINIDRVMKDNNLNRKKVNGQWVNKDATSQARTRNAVEMLNIILRNIDPSQATELDRSFFDYQEAMSTQTYEDIGPWSSKTLGFLEDAVRGNMSPGMFEKEMMKHFGGDGTVFSGGTTSNRGRRGRPRTATYMSSDGVKKSWDKLTENERKRIMKDTMGKRIGAFDIDGASNLAGGYHDDKTESDESWQVRNAVDAGAITANEYTDYMSGRLKFKDLEPHIKRWNEAQRQFTRFSKAGVTSTHMSALSGQSISQMESQGYFTRPQDLLRFIGRDGKLDVRKLGEFNSRYTDSYMSDLDKAGDRRTRGTSFSMDDPMGSMSQIIQDVFNDPAIAKQAGFVTGGAAGLAIGKLLKTAGIVKSNKLGWILGTVGGALMMTERARKSMDAVFGPEGNIKGESGYSNREIFLSKLMTRWLPSIGAGTAVTKATMKLFSKIGPAGMMLGIPASLVTGLTAGFMAPKLMEFAEDKLFGEKGKEKGTFLSKVGGVLSNVPWIKKYFNSKSKAKDIDLHIATIKSERARVVARIITLRKQNENDNLSQDQIEVNKQEIERLVRQEKALERTLEELRSIRNKDFENDEERNYAIGSVLEKLSNDSAFNSEETTARSTNFNKAKQDNNYNARKASSAKFQSVDDIRRSHVKDYLNEHAEELADSRNSTTFKALNHIMNGASTSSIVQALSRKYYDAKSIDKEYLRDMISGKAGSIRDVVGYDNADKLNDILESNKSADEKKIEISRWMDGLSDTEKAGFNRILQTRQAVNKSYGQLFNTTVGILRPQRKGVPLSQIEREAATMAKDAILKQNFEIMGMDYAADKASKLSQALFSTLNTENITDREIVEHNQMLEGLSSLYGGQGRNPQKMRDLTGIRFKNGRFLTEAGCSIVALNNALIYMGMDSIDIPTAVAYANKHLTNQGGVRTSFFIEIGEKLGFKVKVYNSQDNVFSPESLLKLAPSGSRGLIFMTSNVDNSSNHYITIKTLSKDRVTINDPDNDGLTDTTITTLITKLQEVIVLEKVKTGILKEASSIKQRALGGLKNIASKAVLGTSIGRAIDSLSGNKISGRSSNMGFGSTGMSSSEKAADIANIVESIFNRMMKSPLPVAIYDDHTLALTSTDERVKEVLIKDATSRADSASSRKNIQRIKSLSSKKEFRLEREEAQKVQDAIINGKFGGGTGSSFLDGNQEDLQGNKKSKGGLLSALLAAAPVALATIAGALPFVGAWLLSKKTIKEIGHQGKGLTNALTGKQQENTEWNEDGEVTKKATFADPTGFIRNVKNVKNVFKGASMLSTGGVKAVQKLATVGKAGINKLLSGNAIQRTMGTFFNKKVGKGLTQVIDTKGIMMRMTTKFPEIVSSLIGKAEKFFKTVPLPEKVKKSIMGFLIKTGNKISKLVVDKFGGKMAAEAVKQLTSKVMSKVPANIPIASIIWLLGMAVWSSYTGYTNCDKILGIDDPNGPEKSTFEMKVKMAGVKFLWDVLPEVLSTVLSHAPGAGHAVSVPYSIAVAIIQVAVGFDKFVALFDFKQDIAKTIRQNGQTVAEYEKEMKSNQEKEIKDAEKSDKVLAAAIKKEAGDNKASSTTAVNDYNKAVETSSSPKGFAKSNLGTGTGGNEEQKKLWTEKIKKLAIGSLGAGLGMGLGGFFTSKDPTKTDTGSKIASATANAVQETEDEKLKKLLSQPDIKAAQEAWKKGGNQDYAHPVGLNNRNIKITSAFGPRNYPGASKNHGGVDFSTNGRSGLPIYAYKSGKVVQVQSKYGIVRLEHPDGTFSRYLHLSKRIKEVGDGVYEPLKVGDQVAAGSLIGLSGGVGASGQDGAYVPHLHFEVQDKNGKKLDPITELGLDPSVLQLTPANKSKENIDYLERHPYLKEKLESKVKSAEKSLAAEGADAKPPSAAGLEKQDDGTGMARDTGGPSDRSALPTNASSNSTKGNASNPVIVNSGNSLELVKAIIDSNRALMGSVNQLVQVVESIKKVFEDLPNNPLLELRQMANLKN